MGRPKKPRHGEAAVKEDVIRFRVTAEQRRLMESAAKNMGLDLGAWVRSVAFQAARQAEAK